VTAWRVRRFDEHDYAAYARIASIAEGEIIDPTAARAADALWDHARYDRLRVVAVDEEDAPLGYGEIRHEPTRFDPRRYFVRLGIDTGSRRRGIGAAIWERLAIELATRRAEIACLWAGDMTACHAFVTKRGFAEVVRLYSQVLAVASAPLPTPAIAEELAAAGIRITSLAALREERGDEVLDAAWDLHSACRLEHTALGRATPRPFADWLADNVDHERAAADGYLIALAGTRLVGCTTVGREGDDTLRIGLTGVLPGYRRRGIARSLKLRLHAWARSSGIREIHTTVTSANPAMLGLNDALGYAIVGSVGGYELRLGR
jgi:GNAT superfamily N-acetyltransferase